VRERFEHFVILAIDSTKCLLTLTIEGDDELRKSKHVSQRPFIFVVVPSNIGVCARC
jgi:hypothetical protein